MQLNAIIDENVYTLTVPDELIARAEEFFARLDRDMDSGWQMSREWVDRPNQLQRCQIVADKLLTALETENENLGRLTAGYILSRLPKVAAVELDIHGEIQNNCFQFHESAGPQTGQGPRVEPEAPRQGLDRLSAMQQAGQEVTKIFKVGKGFRFSVYHPQEDAWEDSPLVATREEAERLRQIAFKARYQALQGAPSGDPANGARGGQDGAG